MMPSRVRLPWQEVHQAAGEVWVVMFVPSPGPWPDEGGAAVAGTGISTSRPAEEKPVL